MEKEHKCKNMDSYCEIEISNGSWFLTSKEDWYYSSLIYFCPYCGKKLYHSFLVVITSESKETLKMLRVAIEQIVIYYYKGCSIDYDNLEKKTEIKISSIDKKKLQEVKVKISDLLLKIPSFSTLDKFISVIKEIE